jgi:hypothetical protein
MAGAKKTTATSGEAAEKIESSPRSVDRQRHRSGVRRGGWISSYARDGDDVTVI